MFSFLHLRWREWSAAGKRYVAEENARLQYKEAESRPASSLADHLQEFAEAWEGMERQWRASLAPPERDENQRLRSASEICVFCMAPDQPMKILRRSFR